MKRVLKRTIELTINNLLYIKKLFLERINGGDFLPELLAACLSYIILFTLLSLICITLAITVLYISSLVSL